MSNQKLNEVLAVEAGLKSRIEEERTALYHTLQKPALFDGMSRQYRPLREDGDKKPAENRRVQQRAEEILTTLVGRMTTLWNITAAKDYGNCQAKSDIVVDDEVIVKDVPATYILFLEKELINVRTLLTHLPLLDPAETWHLDDNDKLFKGDKIEKLSTAKVEKPVVLYPATIEHPAQTKMVTVDENVGMWEEIKMSGAFPAAEQKRLLARVEKLLAAAKKARERANGVVAPEQDVGGKIFGWLFK